ncbi:MAG: PqqD family protein [Bacteroidales bacterium]|nr:PqqD family protein [Bacteroidales bacterium]
MKIIEGFRLRKLGKEHIVVGEGLAQVNFNKMISLNASAAYLWESVEGKDFTVDDLVSLLLDKYEVEEEIARRDAEALAQAWLEAGVITE